VLLSFVSFSKLVILVYTGPPVENNTAYARYINPIMGTGISRTFLVREK
jgi:hypothetical protein